LINSKLNAEASFHNRAVAMLNQVQNFEQSNLKNEMRQVAIGALDSVLSKVDHPEHAAKIKRASFLAALDGIRTGAMTYNGDAVLPMIEKEMTDRLTRFKGMSKEEEGKLLSLSAEQRKIVAENDRKMKNEFLAAAPAVSHGTLKMTDAYKSYMQMVHSATK